MESSSATRELQPTRFSKETGSDDESGTSFLSDSRRNKRDVLRENGIDLWTGRHKVGLGCACCVAVLFLGFAAVLQFHVHHRQYVKALEGEEDIAQKNLLTPRSEEKTWETSFRFMGCYPLQNGDFVNVPELRDLTCITKDVMGVPCRSGLPFYRFSMLTSGGQRARISWRHCASFCTFKGFDVSGVVRSVECRCGATIPNKGIWHGMDVMNERLDLIWQPPWNEVPANSSKCDILAVQYTGPLPMSDKSYDRTNEDVTYVRSIVSGVKVETEHRDIVRGDNANRLQQPGATSAGTLVATEGVSAKYAIPRREDVISAKYAFPKRRKLQLPGVAAPPPPVQAVDPKLGNGPDDWQDLQDCLSSGGCSTGLPWPLRTEFVGTGIPICFSNTVSKEAKEAVYSVIKELSSATCIRFNQVSPFYNRTAKISVVGDDLSSCFANGVGYPVGPPPRQDIILNLGWCNTMLEKGNILHELGHALGMNHEQTRPDRDAYVEVKWETLPTAEDRYQYEVSKAAYIGSQKAGHVPYDFESIMHYPLTESMHTKPVVEGGRGAHDSQIGQRQQLSPGDILQLRNMYTCDAVHLPCVDDDKGVTEHGPYAPLPGESMVYCKALQEAGECTGQFAADIRYFCMASCNACPEDLAAVQVEGCEDAPGEEAMCERYKDYCPGKVTGYEDYMMKKCRKTCYIERYCGTSTTLREYTTTTKAVKPTGVPKVEITVEFDIVGGGYNLKKKEQQQQLAKDLQVRAEDLFGTDAQVSIDPYSSSSGSSLVKLACDCDPVLQSGCSVSCIKLENEIKSLTTGGTSKINEDLKVRGLPGVEVTSTSLGDATTRLTQQLTQPLVLNCISGIGGIALAVVIVMSIFACWLHTEHKDTSDNYSELQSASDA